MRKIRSIINLRIQAAYFLRITAVVLSAILLFGTLSESIQAANLTITAVYTSFTSGNISAFRFNGTAVQSGSAIVLTPAQNPKVGTAWWKNKVNLGNQRSFSAYFSFTISQSGGYPPGGADGLTFAIQTQSNGAGSAAGGLGYQGITPSIGIEYDTWQNNDPSVPANNLHDVDGNHIGIDFNGNMISQATTAAGALATAGFTLDGGTKYYTWIDYNGSNNLIEVRLSSTASRPSSPMLSYTYDLSTVVGSDVYVGFTAATGGAFSKHEIDSFYFDNDYLAGGIDTSANNYTAGPATVTASASPAVGTSSTISALVKDINGNVMSGQTIDFATNLGSLSSSTSVTNGSGIAQVTLTNNTAGNATVRATGAGGAYGETTVENNVITAVYPNFTSSNIGPFQFNGDAYRSGNAIVLTDPVNNEHGSVWWQNKVTLADLESFSAQFSFTISQNSGGGADGLVFAIQTQSSGAGSTGSGLGFSGIQPSVGIEFDTFQNNNPSIPQDNLHDPDANHIGIDLNGNMTSAATTAAGALTTAGFTLSDGTKHYAWVDYSGSNHLIEVRLSSTTTRPASAILSFTYDLSTVVGSDVYVGFTGSTGGSHSKHEIDSFYFNNDYVPGSIIPPTITYVAGPTLVVTSASPSAGTSSTISALVKDVDGNIMTGQMVNFTTTLGALDSSTAVTGSNGIAQVNLSGSSVGAATVRATGSGGAYGETNVNLQYPTTISLSSSVNPSVYGQSVTFMVHVTSSGGTPTGTVTFSDGLIVLGSSNLSSGQTTYAVSNLNSGAHNITAAYNGAALFSVGTAGLDQTVNTTGTSTALTSSANPSVYGQSVTFTATVSSAGGGTPTGTVQFYIDSSTYGNPVTLNSGRAVSTANSSLSIATHTVNATYLPDPGFVTSASSDLNQVVTKVGTSIHVGSSMYPLVQGQSVTFTATVSATAPGAGTPTGSVTFKDGATTLSTVNLSGGQATYATASLNAASYSLTVVYNADSNFNTSTSNTISPTQSPNAGTSVGGNFTPLNPLGAIAPFSAVILGLVLGGILWALKQRKKRQTSR